MTPCEVMPSRHRITIAATEESAHRHHKMPIAPPLSNSLREPLKSTYRRNIKITPARSFRKNALIGSNITGRHHAVTISQDNEGMDREKLREIKRAIAGSSIGRAVRWALALPNAVETIRTAKTPAGRTVKTLLFGVGMTIPLGVLVVALLFWHGSRINGRSLHTVMA